MHILSNDQEANMPIRKLPNRLTWRGPQTVAEVARKLAKRKPVVVSLPWSFHHALCVQLCDYAKAHGMLNVSGGSELLARIAEITGLQDLAQLREPVRLAGASVRVYSPPAQVHLFFPARGRERPWHAHSHRQASADGTYMAAPPPAASVSA
jgi:hypothetical protein